MNRVAKRTMLGNPEETLWAGNLHRSMEWRKRYTQETMWPAISDHYMHQYGDNRPHFNLIYMMAQTLIPNLVYQAPGIINTPTKPGMVQWASLWDSIDNWWIEQAEIQSLAQDAVLAAYQTNTAVAFIGYDFDDLSKGLQDLSGSADRTRLTNAPWVDFVPAHRVLVAPGTKSMRNCPWIAKFVSVPTEKLKGISGLSSKAIKATSIPSDIKYHEASTWEYRDIEKYTFFWQIHNAETGKWAWLSTGGKFIMGWEDDPYQVHGLPAEVLNLNTNTKSIWGTSDPTYIMSQHLEGDDVRWQNMKQIRTAVARIMYDSNVLDEQDVYRMVSADTRAAIPVNLENDKKITDVIMQLTPQTNFALTEYMKFLLNDAQHITGIGHNQMGAMSPGRRSATEAGIIEGASTSRMGHRRAQVGKFVEGLVRKANKLCAANWDQPIVQQVLGADGALYWVNANPKELEKSGFGVTTKVNIESLAPVSRERRKQEAAELLGLLGTMQEAGANTMPILKQFLSQFEWVDVREVLPQAGGEMGMQDFIGQQEAMMQGGGMGSQAVQNLQGVNSLIERLPAEPQAEQSTGKGEE